MARSQLLLLVVAAFIYYASAQCPNPDSALYIFPYSQVAGGNVNEPMPQLNINATARGSQFTNFTWVVTQIPSGLQYQVTADKLGIYITGTPLIAGGPYVMNVILYYYDTAQNKQKCSAQPVNFQFTCSVATVVSPSNEGAITGFAYSSASPFQFTSTGGFGSGYSYSWNHATLNGVNLTTSGALVGTWAAPGTYSFWLTVSDAGNCADTILYSVVISCPTISITGTLPSGLTTDYYNSSLSSSGGRAPYTYSLVDGLLPAGLSLSANGYIYGTPQGAGSALFLIKSSDVNGCNNANLFGIGVSCPSITLGDINNSTLVDKPFTTTVVPTGGNGPYTFELTTNIVIIINDDTKRSTLGTLLPPDVLLNPATGVISGTPTATGTYSFKVIATDSKGCKGEHEYTIKVSCDNLAIGDISTSGTVTDTYSATLTTTAGTAGYTYSISAGSLPPGINHNSGALTGSFTKNGTYTVSVQSVDARMCQVTRQFTFIIGCPTITTSPFTQDLTATENYYSALAPSGGYGAYHLQQTTGLPAGITVNEINYQFFGTPTEVGEFNVTFTVVDSNYCSNDFSLTMTVRCDFFTFSLIDSTADVDVEYESVISVLNGFVGEVTYELTDDAPLPDGLELSSDGTIAGIPTKSGTFTFDIRATDENGCTDVTTRVITVGCGNSNLAVSSSIPAGQTGVFYTTNFNAGGSTHYPYTYTIVPKSSYPSGVQYNVPTAYFSDSWSFCAASSYATPFTGSLIDSVGENCISAYKYTAFACMHVESSVYLNFAAGESATMFEGVGLINNNNGIQWYILPSGEGEGVLGFANADTELDLTEGCDTAEGYDRTCWTISENIGGFRCGPATDLFAEEGGEDWLRVVLGTNDIAAGLDVLTYTLLENGTIYGLPTIAGHHQYQVTVTDAAGCSASSVGVLQIDCGRFYFEDLPVAQVTIPYEQSLDFSGGSGTYYADIEGLPEGIEYDAEANVLSGVPVVNGRFLLTVRITDPVNDCEYTVEYNFTVLCPPNYLSDIPPVAQVGTTYLTKITYQNMLPPVHFEAGGLLPYGITLYRDGTIEGVPSLPGDYGFYVYLYQDAVNGCSDSRWYTISVVCGPVDISDISNAYMLGDEVDQTFGSSNGVQHYNYSLNSGALPNGLSLTTDGHLSGTVTKAGFFRFSVRAEDTYGCFGVRHFVVAITCTSPLALGDLPTSAMTGDRVAHLTTVLGGVGPFTYELLLGTLPAGLSMNATGHISGTVTTPGVYVFQLGVKDSQGCVATEVYTYIVAAPPVTVVEPPVNNTTSTGSAPAAAGTPPSSTPAETPAVSGQSSIHSTIAYLFATCVVVFISL